MKTSVDLPKDMLEDLDALVEKRGGTSEVNRSQIIRKAINEHLESAREKGELKRK